MPLTTIGEQIRAARTAAGLTQIELAERAGLWQSSISDYERGEEEPDRRTLHRLADAIGCAYRYENGREQFG